MTKPSENSLIKLVLADATRLADRYTADERALTVSLAAAIGLDLGQRERIGARAGHWVEKVRAKTRRNGVIDAFLQEYGLSTNEGIILMRLSEALIRTPDFATAQELLRDKLVAGEWSMHAGSSPASLINAATTGLRFSAAWIHATGGNAAAKLAAKLGDRMLHAAVVRGMGLMAGHFVLGSSIEDAVTRANSYATKSSLHSFDMLGEAALTQADAQCYFDAYADAMRHLVHSAKTGATSTQSDGLSVKLSALHPRYEYAKRASCIPVLIDKIRQLAIIAKSAGVGLTLDAEEADRLELSLLIFTALLNDPLLAGWDGLGIVIQAYQRRAATTIDIVTSVAKTANRSISVRLVKGAYWDAEIKRAQEMGLDSYPVFTRKEHTDVSYLACAAQLLNAGPIIFPQFATHNAHTAAAIIELAGAGIAGTGNRFEFQRLHGMGEALHDEIGRETGIRSRVYAPVGNHKELLPYLVPKIEVDEIVRDPVNAAQANDYSPHPNIPAPRDMFGGKRRSAQGIDFTQSATAQNAEAALPVQTHFTATSLVGGLAAGTQRLDICNPANVSHIIGEVALAAAGDAGKAVAAARRSNWYTDYTAKMRAACLFRAADILEERMPELIGYCVFEAGKTLPDAVSEIREAIDFCRYYAVQAETARMADRTPLGVIACISPWNFPLAIFLGQIAAALAVGNSVVAKPAGQTPLIAHAAVQILYEAGVPGDALQLVIGGADIGAALTGNAGVDGVCFTGSTITAKRIAEARANIGRADTVLIAETGGINAMIIDSTALLEQAVGDIVTGAFQSAGQRCSACRLVCVQQDIADDFDRMLAGAIALLEIGDPRFLATDVGPIIDAAARAKIADYIEIARAKFRVIGEASDYSTVEGGNFIRPIAFAVNEIGDVAEEIFGPVLQVVRFAAGEINAVIDQINALGFGLTLGVHSRIDSRISAIAARAKIGNIYVNRNQIGAVVGVQPFGGEGLSGTGPKAGGPHYLLRLSKAKLPLAVSYESAALLQRQFAAHFAAVSTKLDLPGPTGEQNSLSLVPRGRLILAGDADHLPAQICACLASGNTGIVSAELAGQAAAILAELHELNPQTATAIEISEARLSRLLECEVDGIIADGNERDRAANLLARRTGAIIPLLSVDDDPERYFHERTLTIDTTAAGGNASLLAMQADSDT
jgi:RHH-type transcriptional regulator, proline utilization regulon repressor / proline dehydrogenase / delta 1-pyrroline-5-carboxylate dehydrogenase